jgi:hypothetical protein
MHEKYTRLSQFASPLALGVLRLAAVTGAPRTGVHREACDSSHTSLPKQPGVSNLIHPRLQIVNCFAINSLDPVGPEMQIFAGEGQGEGLRSSGTRAVSNPFIM